MQKFRKKPVSINAKFKCPSVSDSNRAVRTVETGRGQRTWHRMMIVSRFYTRSRYQQTLAKTFADKLPLMVKEGHGQHLPAICPAGRFFNQKNAEFAFSGT
jgi:hypothetical protein